jgi:hypothetical protein
VDVDGEAAVMDCTRDQFLSGASLTKKQHSGTVEAICSICFRTARSAGLLPTISVKSCPNGFPPASNILGLKAGLLCSIKTRSVISMNMVRV